MVRKKRALLMSMLCLALAALIAVAVVLGVGAARYETVVGSEAAAGEARWSVSVGTVEGETTVPAANLRPDFVDYATWTGEGNTGPRTKDWFGCVATLKNTGDVAAYVSLVEGESQSSPVDDSCGSVDHNRYDDVDVSDHVKVSALYYSESSSSATASTDSDVSSLENVKIEPGDFVYIYASVTWYTDLTRDMNNTNQPYDGTQGDEFDTWAGKHLLSVVFTVTLRCEQAS